MKKWMIACMALLGAMACDDEIDHSGEVHATAIEVYSVGVTSAVFDAEIYGKGVTERGICWSEEQNPTTDDAVTKDPGTGAGPFSAELVGLEPSTTYYVRAYAIAGPETYYSSQLSFTTYDELTATIQSAVASLDYIVVSGTVAGGADTWAIAECGVAYGLEPEPTVADAKAAARETERGDFSVTVSGLEPGTTYYLRPYVISDNGTEYGEQTEVTTLTADQLRQLFVDRLGHSRLMFGSVYAGNAFAMHYSLDLEAGQVVVSYIEPDGDRDVRHVSQPCAFNEDFSELTWTPVANGSVEFGGIALDATSLTIKPVGSAGLVLGASMTADEIYSIFVPKAHGGIDRVSELHKGNYHGSVDDNIYNVAGNCVEYNGSSGGFITSPWNKTYLLFKNTTDGSGKPVIPIKEDVAVFSFGEYAYPYGGSLTDDEVREVEQGLASLTDVLYDTDGLIVVKATNNTLTPTQGDFDYYMISSKGVEWLQWYLRADGK